MRKFAIFATTTAVALVVALLLPSTARADGSTVITVGPGQYDLTFTHPTGTVSVGGGTISARCTAFSVKGSPVYLTPRCTTRPIGCPTTAAFCSVVWNGAETAARGPVAFGGGVLWFGAISNFHFISPYNCPQPVTCGARFGFDVGPGTYGLSQVVNIASPNYVTVFNQVTVTIH